MAVNPYAQFHKGTAIAADEPNPYEQFGPGTETPPAEEPNPYAQFGSGTVADRGPSAPAPGGASAQPVAAGGNSALGFTARPGTPLGMLSQFVDTSVRRMGEGQVADTQAILDRFNAHKPQRGDSFLTTLGKRVAAIPDLPLDAVALSDFVTRPIFAPIEQGISNLTGNMVSPDQVGTDLMALGPEGGGPKPVPRGAVPPPESPWARPAIPGAQPMPRPPEPTPAPPVAPPVAPPAAAPPPTPVQYSPEARAGQIRTLVKKIDRAELDLPDMEAAAAEDPRMQGMVDTLRENVAQWKAEHEALVGGGDATVQGSQPPVNETPAAGVAPPAAAPAAITAEPGGAPIKATPDAHTKFDPLFYEDKHVSAGDTVHEFGDEQAVNRLDNPTVLKVNGKKVIVGAERVPAKQGATNIVALVRGKDLPTPLKGEKGKRLYTIGKLMSSDSKVAEDLVVSRDWRRKGIANAMADLATSRGVDLAGAPVVNHEGAQFLNARKTAEWNAVHNTAVRSTAPAGTPAKSVAARRAKAQARRGAPPNPPGGGAGPPSPPTPPGGAATPAPRPRSPGAMDFVKALADRVHKLLSPTTVDAAAGRAEAIIREHRGTAARDMEVIRAGLDRFQKVTRKLSPVEQLSLIDYIENRSKGAKLSNPVLQPLADALREVFGQVQYALEKLPGTENMSFITDYFPHLWEDPKAVQTFLSERGFGKQGSGAFTKERKIPTVAEGIKAGLKLRTMNPIDATMQYVENAFRFISTEKIIMVAKGMVLNSKGNWVKSKNYVNRIAKYYAPTKQPAGYVALNGRVGAKQTRHGPMQLYAPEGFARVYNNAISKNIPGPAGDLIAGFQRASNFATALELGFSGYHAFTMSQEAVVSGVAAAVRNLVTGHPIRAARNAALAATNPVRLALIGGKGQRIYTRQAFTPFQKATSWLTPGAQEIQKTVDLLEKANGRAVKMDQHYLSARRGSYVKSFKRGTLTQELADDAIAIGQRPVWNTLKVIAQHMGRIVDTVSSPMFEQWIPRLKVGAFHEHMSEWLLRNPNAGSQMQEAVAREIWDSVDNRFGELVSDNLFWEQWQKQIAQISLRSYTWTFGSLREIGGGAVDFTKAPYKIATGQKAKWTQRMDYVIALPIVYATMAAVYQYLKTGQLPQNEHDLIAPRTGGKDPATGKAERVIMPGYMKDVFGWYDKGLLGEAWNKMANLPRTTLELATNKDWRGMPIAPNTNVPGAPSSAQLYAEHAISNLTPFSFRNAARGQRRGSNISTFETWMGSQPAGRWLADPVGTAHMRERLGRTERKAKARADARDASRYKGPR